MDKYEFNIKVEQIRKLVAKGDYETAMKIADTIDWKKVRNANQLSMVAQIYEKNEEYQEAKDILLLAFERAPIGKRLLYKLTELALKEGNTEEAEAYYREFCDLAGDDPRQHLLRFLILKGKGAPMEQLIHSLESYTAEELDEKWLYELAELYHEIGNETMCISTCDKIMLMFGLGKYVDKAMELKIQYAPLTKYQMDLVENRDKYEAKLRAVAEATVEEPEDVGGIPNAPEPVDEIIEDPIPESIYTSVPEPEVIVAAVKQAEVEEHLAKEMSKITVEDCREEDDLGKTRVLGDIKRAQILNQETTILPNLKRMPKEEEEPTAYEQEMPRIEDEMQDLAVGKMNNHLMIESRNPEKGMELALKTLKQIQNESGVKNPVVKITGSKLNQRGILENLEKLSGKDLLIEEAGDLNQDLLKELNTLMAQDSSGMRIILIDNPKQMEMLHAQNPTLASKFECIGNGSDFSDVFSMEPEVPIEAEPETEVDDRPVRRVVPVRDSAMRMPETTIQPDQSDAEESEEDEEEMDIDEFAQYACKYASEIDCSITGKSMLALYERIEIMEEEGVRLTKISAEELIEEAADRAEHPSLGKLISGVFSSKYDKDGLLILKEEHFI